MLSATTTFWGALAAVLFAVACYLGNKLRERYDKLDEAQFVFGWIGVAVVFVGGCGFTYLFCHRLDCPPAPVVPLAIWQEQEWVDENGQVIVVVRFDDEAVIWKLKEGGAFTPQRQSPRTEFLPGMRFKTVVTPEKAK